METPVDAVEACADYRAEQAWHDYRHAVERDCDVAHTARIYLAREAELSAIKNESVHIDLGDATLEREAIAMSSGYAIGDYQLVAWGEIAGRAWQLRLSR